jgi:hypothetical protein
MDGTDVEWQQRWKCQECEEDEGTNCEDKNIDTYW